MIGYILRRIAYGFLILLGVNALTFALFFAVNTPDDMARLAIGGRYVKKNAMLPMPAAWNARPSAFFFPGLLCFPGTAPAPAVRPVAVAARKRGCRFLAASPYVQAL